MPRDIYHGKLVSQSCPIIVAVVAQYYLTGSDTSSSSTPLGSSTRSALMAEM